MQRNQIIMYQNISFKVKRMGEEDLLAEKRGPRFLQRPIRFHVESQNA
jgi:hypothetical protein